MAMPGKDHVLIAVKANPHGVSGMLSSQGRQGSGEGCLCFLAAEAPAHPGTLDNYFVHGQMQHVGDHGLDFRWMLGRGSDEYRAVFARLSPGRLRFQIEVFLAAQFKSAREREWRISKRFGRLTAPNVVGLIMKTARCQGLLESENGRQWLKFD